MLTQVCIPFKHQNLACQNPHQNFNKRIHIIHRNAKKHDKRQNSGVKTKGGNRKASMITNSKFGTRKYKKAVNKLLPAELIDREDHNQTYSVKQNKKLSAELSNSHIEYSNYHQTIENNSNFPKFVRTGPRKQGFKSTNTRLPQVRNNSNNVLRVGKGFRIKK